MINTYFVSFCHFLNKSFSVTYVNYVDQTKETSESSVKLKMNIDFGDDDDEASVKVANFKRMKLHWTLMSTPSSLRAKWLWTELTRHLGFDQDESECMQGKCIFKPGFPEPPCFDQPVNATELHEFKSGSDKFAISAVRMFSRSHKSCFQMLSKLNKIGRDGGDVIWLNTYVVHIMYHCLR